MLRMDLEPVDGYPPRVGAVVRQMEDGRLRTLDSLDGHTVDVDWMGVGADNSVGTLLYHVAAIELDWVFADILGIDFPDEAYALFPHEVREDGNRLSPVLGESLDTHLGRMARTRELVLGALTGLTDDDLDRPRAMMDQTGTPAWAFHHLLQHEAEHRGQMMAAISARDAQPAE